MSTFERLEPPPGNTAFDFALQAAKVATIVFPWAGPGVVLFDVLTGPARSKRLIDWCEELRLRLNNLGAQVEGLTPEALAANEAFISAFAQATQAALKTHQPEKIEALRNAILNVALGHEPSADRQAMFLALADRFTVLHLSMIRFFHDPARYLQQRGIAIPSVTVGTRLLAKDFVRTAMPNLGSQIKSLADRPGSVSQFVELILGELVSAKLIALDVLHGTWAVPGYGGIPTAGAVGPLTTHLGDDFLVFISEPVERGPR